MSHQRMYQAPYSSSYYDEDVDAAELGLALDQALEEVRLQAQQQVQTRVRELKEEWSRRKYIENRDRVSGTPSGHSSGGHHTNPRFYADPYRNNVEVTSPSSHYGIQGQSGHPDSLDGGRQQQQQYHSSNVTAYSERMQRARTRPRAQSTQPWSRNTHAQTEMRPEARDDEYVGRRAHYDRHRQPPAPLTDFGRGRLEEARHNPVEALNTQLAFLPRNRNTMFSQTGLSISSPKPSPSPSNSPRGGSAHHTPYQRSPCSPAPLASFLPRTPSPQRLQQQQQYRQWSPPDVTERRGDRQTTAYTKYTGRQRDAILDEQHEEADFKPRARPLQPPGGRSSITF